MSVYTCCMPWILCSGPIFEEVDRRGEKNWDWWENKKRSCVQSVLLLEGREWGGGGVKGWEERPMPTLVHPLIFSNWVHELMSVSCEIQAQHVVSFTIFAQLMNHEMLNWMHTVKLFLTYIYRFPDQVKNFENVYVLQSLHTSFIKLSLFFAKKKMDACYRWFAWPTFLHD